MNLILAIVHKTKKAKKLYYTGDDPKINRLCNVNTLNSQKQFLPEKRLLSQANRGLSLQKQNNKLQY